MRDFSAAELVQMQVEVNSALPSSGTIKHVTRVSDGAGGYTETWATVATVNCRIDALNAMRDSQTLRVYAARLGERQANWICFPAGTDVQEGDEVTVDSVVYEVMGILVEGWELVRQTVVARQA